MKRKIVIILVNSILIYSMFSILASASSWYAGTTKWGAYTGIEAFIQAPENYPILGSSGESSWVTNVKTEDGYTNWIQTGVRYYAGYSGLKIYVETNINGIYNMNESIGFHGLGSTKFYSVKLNSSGTAWEARVDGFLKGSAVMSTTANVQAQSEAHATNTQMGPFLYSGVRYFITPTVSAYMDVAPTANLPFHTALFGSYYYSYLTYGGDY